MRTRISKRTLAIAVLFAATAVAIFFMFPAPSHAARSQAVAATSASSQPILTVRPITHPSVASNVLASAGASQTTSFASTHGPCVRCLYAHSYSAEVLGLAPLTSHSG